ncbi:uncharacterized protein si:dkey-171c9.3 [Myxocyprinus asiaticus]|uniref:uncharacterized protein si:dkey-171c9.3 n=1 Tax=Myxocyprinus asiaticus TaxID=70543 RepID=UPI0022225F7A|nr:uncharacterized protein si:dkey-171c9.3 [Myxocyprinus asiaticus]XP_051578890.1 uncharacterized protein si:dkey-171c9.3 [Myxocyprinus asiaticus]
MTTEEWLCSTFKLCNLVTSSESGHSGDSMQKVINSDSYPQPAYNPSSIQLTLETYSRLLDKTSELNMKHIDQKVMELDNEQIESIDHFAQMTAKSVIDSAMMTGEYHLDNICNLTDPRESIKVRGNDVDMLAEELTLQVCCKALQEMGKSSKERGYKEAMEGICENASVMCASGYHCDENTSEMETKMEEYDEASGTTVYATALNSMASLGSIDYPDAPPSTPLLPEMMKSRASFTRKLKGGLAKEFLPSPPPPTPKDQMQSLLANQMTDTSADKSDFMVRLLHSLSLEYCQHEGVGEEDAEEVDDGGHQNEIPRLYDYAAQLSADILHCITANTIEVNGEGSMKRVQATAYQLVDDIFVMSFAELIEREKIESIRDTSFMKEEATSYSTHKPTMVDMASVLDTASQQRPSMQFSAAEGVNVLASELILNAMVQAFANLKQGVFKHGTHPHFLGQATELQPWEKGRYSNTHLCTDSIQSHNAKTFSCCNNKSELNPITFDSSNMTSSAVYTFAENFAEDSVGDASSLLLNFRKLQRTHVEVGSQKDIKSCIIKTHAEESHDVQELQCALLWAAASQKGISALQFHLPDTSLQHQLCRLSRSAHVNGWTVGALMASLYQFCDMQQETSRGHYESSDSLLEHLQCLIDSICLN